MLSFAESVNICQVIQSDSKLKDNRNQYFVRRCALLNDEESRTLWRDKVFKDYN